ncbi:VWA domain-containing protein [Nonomuraea sp. NPDC050663]|uniref:VWA domain-containing protein n=1 Tax=Nonomuraea sp. NPDC050663 TaxID=3364370 RepID=UPI0037997C9B
MTFDTPVLLAAGLLLVVALAVVAVRFARRRAALLAEAGVAARGAGRSGLGVWLTLAGLAVLAVAASGPAALIPVPRAAGVVILAVDVSGSMGATDIAPSRLAAAQQVARSFIEDQPASVDIGVVAFEEGALTTARPDADHTRAVAAIDRLKVTGGTSLAAAITGSLSAITGKPVALARGQDDNPPDLGYWPSATIVIISDGHDLGARADEAADLAARAGVHIDTVGVGTTAGTSVKVDGYRLQTALDPEALTAVAEATGGTYHPASTAGDLGSVASAIDLRLTVSDEPVPLAGALICCALALLGAGSALTILRSGRVI